MHDVAEFLKEHHPFRELDAAAIEGLAEHVEVEFFVAGSLIFRQGSDHQNEVRVIRRGAVELVDHDRVLDLLGEGELFGHPAMMSGLPNGLEVRAHDDLLCYAMAAEDVIPLLARPASPRQGSLEPGGGAAAHFTGFELSQQRAGALIRTRPPICDPDLAIREAAEQMSKSEAGSVLVRLDEGGLGIVTDRDLRARVIVGGLSAETPVREVMTVPVFSVGPDRTGAEVLLAMLDRGIRHVPVVSSRWEVLGMITDADLLAAEAQTPFLLRRAIAVSRDGEELRHAAARLHPTVLALHETGLAPVQISPIISVVVDALVRRTIELTTAALAPAPVEFAWLSLGSHGRREAVPSSDIDSGMVWSEAAGSDPTRHMRHIADKVIRSLTAAGWESDVHGATASDPVVARSVTDWLAAISQWLDHPDEKALIAISILLDSRTVYGPQAMHDRVLSSVRTGRERTRVLRWLLRLALTYAPPTGFVRDFVVEHSGQHRGSLDIKQGGVLPIVGIARYAGLSAAAAVTSTVERLRAAAAEGKLQDAETGTLVEAYELFTGLRLEHQIEQLQAGMPPDNHLDPAALNPLARRYLRDAFRAVRSVQKKLAVELRWSS